MVERVRDHDLVADRGDDDPGDDDDVEIRVPVPRQPRALLREREPPLCDRGNEVEVEPPEGRGREERETERSETRGVERQLRGRRARNDDRLAEGDDDEQLEALGEVRGLDVPGGRVEPRSTRHPVESEGRQVVDRDRDQPERDP